MIVFRADASTVIGSGHVARCLTLAEALRAQGASSVFVSRTQDADTCAGIAARGFECIALPRAAGARGDVEATLSDAEQEADAAETIAALDARRHRAGWVAVDHYGLAAAWERSVAARGVRVLVVDDLANRAHDCDVLLDQNYVRDLAHRYDGLVPPRCTLLLGPSHVLLRPEFAAAKATARPRDGSVKRLLVEFGGGDASGETVKALNALQGLADSGLAVDVVAGSANPRRAQLRSLCERIPRCTYHEQVGYMAELMVAADLALGAGGATRWERCALGLPALTVATAPNQVPSAVDMAAYGATIYLGEASAVDAGTMREAIAAALADPARVREVGLRAQTLVPAVDGAERLARRLLQAAGGAGRSLPQHASSA